MGLSKKFWVEFVERETIEGFEGFVSTGERENRMMLWKTSRKNR